MTEQVRTISRKRVVRHAGRADPEALAEIRGWITDFVNE
jgi:mRNA interferase MazF